MDAEFLGTGWRFPILPNAGGGLGYVSGDANLEQSLLILLQTAVGERVMRKSFGTRLPEMVFAPGSPQSLSRLETSVREAVRDYEPRAELEDVRAELDPKDETRVTVSVQYRVRQSNTRNNLVFPFYVGTLGWIMTLRPVGLDDLTWADLMAEIRAAIPAESAGAWTLHAPVDPGVTLLELYASQLEERLFWLSQVPDALVSGILALLGVPPPAPAVAATTVLSFESGDYQLPAGTALSSPGDAGGVVVTTEDDLAVLPVAGVRLIAQGCDRTAELRRGAGVAGGDPFGASGLAPSAGVDLLPADGGFGEAEIVLTLPAAAAPPPGGALALALLIEPDGLLPPSWAPDAVTDVPPPADVAWWYAADGGIRAFPPAAVQDGTGGLRRSGVVRLPWPHEWRTPAAAGSAQRRIVVRSEAATFAAPPRLVAMWPNAVTASHRRAVDSDADAALGPALASQASHWLPLPARTLEIPSAAGRLLDDPDRVQLDLVERYGAEHPWRATDDFAFHGPADRVFTIDRPRGVLWFGDGLTGRIPVPEVGPAGLAAGVRLRFELGGGEAGNRGSHLPWETVAAPVRSARNVAPLTGGTEPETIAAARARAGEELTRRYRAVTGPDHATITKEKDRLGVPVARVHVGVGRHPAFPCVVVPGAVTVVIVPDIRRDPGTGLPVVAAPRPDPGMLTAVQRRLDAARLAGSEIYVAGPSYRLVALTVTVAGGVANPAGLHAELERVLARYLDPLVGAAGDGWPFGGSLRPSELLGAAEGAVGSAATIVAVGVGLDGASPDEDCDDVELRPHELPVLAGLDVKVSAELQTDGGLR